MNAWNQKRTSTNIDKKRTNWNQSLRTPGTSGKVTKPKKIKKSLQYLLVLRKFNNVINYKNVKLLRAFLTKYGKIRSRRKTRLTLQNQHRIAKAIRKSRALGILPFTCDVKI